MESENRPQEFKDCTIAQMNTEHHYHQYGILNNPNEIQINTDLQQKAIELCQKQQIESMKRDRYLVLQQYMEDLPVVHPQLVNRDIYLGNAKNPLSLEKQPTTHNLARRNKLLFEDLEKHSSFLALVGGPGSGKTTLSKRLVKLFESRQKFVVFLKCRELKFVENLTCKQLFIDYPYPELNETQKMHAFQWMLANKDKCTFVLDGYDQAPWSLENVEPSCADYKTPLPIDQLVANLCSKKFFSTSGLIFTSRPYSLLKISSFLRPTTTVYVDDLARDDMKTLFYALADKDADQLWKTLTACAPQLFELCCNPLLLQFIVHFGLHQSLTDKTTITKVLTLVLDHLRHSKHAKASKDILVLHEPLGRMAYKGISCKTVGFTKDNLDAESLEPSIVQDVIIAVAHTALYPNHRLFAGDQRFFFVHQMLQDILAAKYITEFMPITEFIEFIQHVVIEEHWAAVRRFLCGLILGQVSHKAPFGSWNDQTQLVENTDKPTAFLKQIVNRLRTYKPCGIGQNGRDLLELVVDLQECNEKILEICTTHFPVELDFSHTHISTGAAYALGQILQKLPHDVTVLNFTSCGLTSESLFWICTGISNMKFKVKKLILNCNRIDKKCTRHLTNCLDKVEALFLNTCAMTFDELEILSTGLQTCSQSLHELDLSWNKIGLVGLQHLSKSLPNIRSLILGNCGVTANGIEEFTKVLKNLTIPMKKLDISENQTGDVGANLLASNLDKMERLVMQDCGVTSAGAEDFANQLKHYSVPIKELNLSYNEIGHTGARKLLASLDKIEKLVLWKENLTTKQYEALCAEMKFLNYSETKIEWK